MQKRLFLPLALSIVGLSLAACGVAPGSGTATPTPAPTNTPTPTEGTPTPVKFQSTCITTLALATEPIKATIGEDPVPTAFDAINSGSCTFTKPVTRISITIEGPGVREVIDIPLPSPMTDVPFPLPSNVSVPVLDESLSPGSYTREVVAYTAGGESTEVGGFQPFDLVQTYEVPQANLDSAEALWQSGGPAAYKYTIQWHCFCLDHPVVVEVHDGQVTSVTWADPEQTGEIDFPEKYGPIPQLFGNVQDAIDGSAAHITADYDETLGYPTSVFIDQSMMMADEEYGWSITNFEVL